MPPSGPSSSATSTKRTSQGSAETPSVPAIDSLSSDLTVYTTETVRERYGWAVKEIVLRAFGEALEEAGADYSFGCLAAEPVPVPEGVTDVRDLHRVFSSHLPTDRTSSRCNLLVADERGYEGDWWATPVEPSTGIGRAHV